jgi:N6-adenosine-specific RNA methylase IME4
MSDDEIAEFPMEDIIDSDGGVLFLWATVPRLYDAMKFMDYWGFDYKTKITWYKAEIRDGKLFPGRLGLGFWFRGAIEECLVGTMGEFRAFHCQEPNIIIAPRREHSRKPEEFWTLIEPLSPAPRVELFCRGAPRPGWAGWGLQCTEAASVRELDDYCTALGIARRIPTTRKPITGYTPGGDPQEGPMYREAVEEMTDETRDAALGGLD